jgi:hypothetical protein
MAEKRMFSKKIIDTDWFMDMPASTQNLYFHLSMNADDDGFINNPKKIQRMIGCSDDDLRLLAVKNFIIPFDSGVVVIKHWKIHNYIRGDRKKATVYPEEMALLTEKDNGAYSLKIGDESAMSVSCQSSDSQVTVKCQHRLGKDSIGEYSIVEDSINNISPSATTKAKPTKHKYGEYKNVLLTDDEYAKLQDKLPDYDKWIETLSEGIELKGYKYKSHYLAILKWARNDKKDTANTKSSNMFLDMLKESD